MQNTTSTVPLAGYSDRLSLRPGETIGFKISSNATEPFQAWLTRSISADPNPDGPGIIEEPVEDAFPEQSFPSRFQPFFPGSYGITDTEVTLPHDEGFLLSVLIFPTLRKPAKQTILSVGEVTLSLNETGAAAFCIGGNQLTTSTVLELRCWYRLDALYNPRTSSATLRQIPIKSATPGAAEITQKIANPIEPSALEGPVCIAARWHDHAACDHFNGKIEAPTIFGGPEATAGSVIARWDFSRDISSTRLRDDGPNDVDARLFNLPARAMTGANWDASEMCWRHAREQYGAIHFHDDDIYDFGWKTDFTFTPPADLPSGVYVMHIRCGVHADAMPFYVCAPKGQPRSRFCVLIPTFTYAVYGNHARPDYDPSWQARITAWDAYPHNAAEHRDYGLSTYNYHSDNSGICHASHRRPLFNLRPDYLTFGTGEGSGLRHFQADSHLISWLHAKGIDYDVITDRELHDEGVSAIADYDAVTTTSHPEYHTRETLDALQNYRDNGGNLLYLGGNGFYWRIALHQEEDGAIEIRRAEDGIRAWAAEPGEYYNAFDGNYGGLWRRNGRPPQMLAGVGFSAQGEFNGSYYRRKCFDPQYDWIFEGVEGDLLGDFGFSGSGAAGFELDRADQRLGTPENCTVLASSEKHGKDFMLVPEEQLTHLTNWAGEPEEKLLRADMVYFEVPGGGSVFATGSITFCGSLPWNDYENNVSKLLENVVWKAIE
ncbi:N,N-dimethylformamidase beta subunit family domain-containing protein [Pelagibius sp. Alg239-R121]|uniref:N,N-dimethylformamidase beta subunit family domain-containing protein n=1 Tax=Pelagibius sp. Alg239-R121 TaxID=2993448 RepID=UPI0024A74CB3|nr:N,N-dimethylformamidase beta subunit family domain-containing protein [Pelagibius sp. Alg239-R121]